MGQEVRGIPQEDPLTRAADAREPPLGRYLAGQRKLRGVSLDDLAALTRIPRRSLERLEGGAFDDVSDGFVRGFVRTVAEALGLDPDETVMRLMAEPEGDEVHPGAVLSRAVVVWLAAGALALLLGLGVWWLASGGEEIAETPSEDAPVMRRDPVRDLAREAASASPQQ